MGHVPGWLAQFHGGDLVSEGVYWNPKNLKFIQIVGTVDFLPGKRDRLYIRLPIFVVPIAALVLGLVYVIALSLAPLFLVGWLGIRGVSAAFRHIRADRFAVGWN